MPEGRVFIDLVNGIEEKIEPARCQYVHFNYWPIIRFLINAKRKRRLLPNPVDLPNISKGDRFALHMKAYLSRSSGKSALNDLEARASERVDIHSLEELPPANVLFLTRKKHYLKTLDKLATEPLTDGIRLLTKETGSQLTLVDGDPRAGSDQFLVDTHILPLPTFRTLINFEKPRSLAELKARYEICRTVERVNGMIPNDFAQLRLELRDVLMRIANSSNKMMIWTAVLDHIRPKAIFLSSYTGMPYVCAAGKRLKIPVIDVQHGAMHSNHPLAANWHRSPRSGYELLPDYFWCWDERSASYINSANWHVHRAVVGGNPKTALDYRLRGDEGQKVPKLPREKARPQVLVGLQYGSDPMIEAHVKEAYLATRDHIDWRFRLHPRGWNFLDEVVAEFDVSEATVCEESSRPLHQVLPEIDLMLCNASTIIHEALDYGAAGAVWSHKGAAIFDELVDAGKIGVATDFELLMRVLSRLQCHGFEGPVRSSTDLKQKQNIDQIRKTFAALTGQ